MLNLVSNALKFTPTNGLITIKARLINPKVNSNKQEYIDTELAPYLNEDDMLEISVADNGMGIKEQDKYKLFQLYGYIRATQEVNTRGIGLGLHISRKIVRQLGGEIICKSKWREGSTFKFIVRL